MPMGFGNYQNWFPIPGSQFSDLFLNYNVYEIFYIAAQRNKTDSKFYHTYWTEPWENVLDASQSYWDLVMPLESPSKNCILAAANAGNPNVIGIMPCPCGM